MKILTALNNNKIYEKLKKEFKNSKKYQILHKDIIYKEGIIEFLKVNSDINLLILNTNIDGNIHIFTLVKEILEINKHIEIIVILKEDNIEIRKFLSSYNINKVLIEGLFKFDELLQKITNDNSIKQKTIEKELEELRNIIFENKEKTFKNKIKNKINNLKEKKKIKNKEREKNKRIKQNKRKEVKEQKKNKIKNTDEIDEKENRIYFTLSEEIQKYNISSIDITIKIKK